MQTESQVHTFQRCYGEWRAASDLYASEIQNLQSGDSGARERLTPIIADLAEKHRRFMESAKPFVYPQ